MGSILLKVPIPVTSGGIYPAGSMDAFFDYQSYNENSLTALAEPTTEALDILVYTTGSPISVTYSYCTPAPGQF